MKININKYEKPLIIYKINRVYKKKSRMYKNIQKNVFPTEKYSYWHGKDGNCPIGSTAIGRYLIYNIT